MSVFSSLVYPLHQGLSNDMTTDLHVQEYPLRRPARGESALGQTGASVAGE